MADDTLKNAAIGAVASIVLFFLPFSPALGGALAGYLQGPDTDEGLRVGALSGAIAAIPLAVLAVLVAALFILVSPGGRAVVGFLVFFLVMLLVALVYGVGLGALGGLLGAYLKAEFDESPESGAGPSTRETDAAPERPAFEGPAAGDDESGTAGDDDSEVTGGDANPQGADEGDRR